MRPNNPATHGEQTPSSPSAPGGWRRLAPFARRDLHASARFAAAIALLVLSLCVYLAASLAGSSATAADARFSFGIEPRPSEHAIHGMQFTEAELARAQNAYDRSAQMRVAVLDDLHLRTLHARAPGSPNDAAAPSVDALLHTDALSNPAAGYDHHGEHRVRPLFESTGDRSADLEAAAAALDALLRREGAQASALSDGIDRAAFVSRLRSTEAGCDQSETTCTRLLSWIEQGGAAPLSPRIAVAVRHDVYQISRVLEYSHEWYDACHPFGADSHDDSRDVVFHEPHEPLELTTLARMPAPWRYTSPSQVRPFLFGIGGLLWIIAWFLLTVVSPATATYRTAHEQEMGTFPNLRMTGLSSRQLAAAVAVASNMLPLGAGIFSLLLAGLAWSLIGLGGAFAASLPSLGCGVLVGLSLGLVIGQSQGRRKNPTLLAVFVAAGSLVGSVFGIVGIVTVTPSWSLLGPGALGLGGLMFSGIPAQFDNASAVTVTGWSAASLLCLSIVGTAATVWITQRVWARTLERPFAVPLTRREGLLTTCLATAAGICWIRDHAVRWDWSLAELGMGVFFIALALASVTASVALASTHRPALEGVSPTASAIRRAYGWTHGVLAVAIGLLAAAVCVTPTGYEVCGELETVLHSGGFVPVLVQAALTIEVTIVVILLRARSPQSLVRTVVLGLLLVGGNYALTLTTVALDGFHGVTLHIPFVAPLVGLLATGVSPIWVGIVIVLWLATAAALLLLLSGRGLMSADFDGDVSEDDDEDDDDSWEDPGPPVIH